MSTYSSNLRIELPTDGTQAGTWGNTTNSNMAFVMDSAIAGYLEVTVSAASQALTYTNGPSSIAASNQAIYAMLKIISAPSAFSLYAPPNSKTYIIWNASGYTMSLRVSDVIGSTTPISGNVALSIANGNKVMVWSDGVSFYEVQASNLTGTLAIANGGTGQTTANAALNALLPSQTSNANKYLQTDGTNTSWDAVNLSTSDITGTLAVANGGTGVTSSTGSGSNVLSTSPTLSSPALTGTPTAPTAAVGTSTTQIATTQFVQAAVPSGVITMWYGSIASIPSGWYLCNGLNGTPDLRDRFIVGAGSSYAVGATGGNANAVLVSHNHVSTSSFTGTPLGTHTHTATDSGHTHSDTGSAGVFGTTSGPDSVQNFQNTHTTGTGFANISVSSASAGTPAGTISTSISIEGVSGIGANLPPYYALAYIMKA